MFSSSILLLLHRCVGLKGESAESSLWNEIYNYKNIFFLAFQLVLLCYKLALQSMLGCSCYQQNFINTLER